MSGFTMKVLDGRGGYDMYFLVNMGGEGFAFRYAV